MVVWLILMIYHGQIRKQITKTKQIQEYNAKNVMSGELKTIFQNGFIFCHKTCFARFHKKYSNAKGVTKHETKHTSDKTTWNNQKRCVKT